MSAHDISSLEWSNEESVYSDLPSSDSIQAEITNVILAEFLCHLIEEGDPSPFSSAFSLNQRQAS